MRIFTTQKTADATIVNDVAALTTPVASTTLDTAVSSGDILSLVSNSGFTAGCSITVDTAGDIEFFVVAEVLAGNDLRVFVDVAIAHSIGAAVGFIDFIPDETPDPDGFSRNNLVNGKLHQDFTLTTAVKGFSYLIDTGIAVPLDIRDIAIVVKNHRTGRFWLPDAKIISADTSLADGLGVTLREETNVFSDMEWGLFGPVAISNRATDFAQRYIIAGFNGDNPGKIPEIAQLYLLQRHQLTSAWENVQTRSLLTGSTIHRHRSGIVDVISHSSEPRQRITGVFKNITEAEVDTLFTILRLSRGPFHPIIIDALEDQESKILILARFVDDKAVREQRIDFDLWNVTIELETLQLPDDL